MGKKFTPPKARTGASLVSGKGELPPNLRPDDHLLISLKHFDRTQGQSFYEWQSLGLLAEALMRVLDHSGEPVVRRFGDKFKQYGPRPAHSKFTHPRHVPPDAVWASMHVKGEECMIGHMIGSVFYLVFLDKEHDFWPSQKRNT